MSTWYIGELASRTGLAEDEVRLNLFTLGITEVAPGRFPITSLALLNAWVEGYPICKKCMRTGDVGPCECKGRIERLGD